MPDRITSAAFQPEARVICGDALQVLRTLEAESVHCVVTSPPYWSLRDYGTGTWEGGDAECDHKKANRAGVTAIAGNTLAGVADLYSQLCPKCGAVRVDKQLGLESTVQEYVANIVEVFREVRRVLRSDGTLWLNIGSSYAAGPTGHQDISAAKGKAAQMFAKGGRYRVDNMRKDTVRALGDEYALRDDLTPSEVAYVLRELAAHFPNGSEILLPDGAVDIDGTVASLADGE